MSLALLEIKNLRNLEQVKIEPSPRFNLLYGDNGSGKTSLLEAIHYLALGRSFRTRLHSRLTQHKNDSFSLFAHIQEEGRLLPVGIQRHLNGAGQVRINQENASSLIEVTKALPIRLLYSESRLLLTGNSKLRRQFMDWGVFHVEHAFLKRWQHAQRALKQRNAALRARASRSMVRLWEKELAEQAECVHLLRRAHIEQFTAVFARIIPMLLPQMDISITYKAGWNEELGLPAVWDQAWSRDMDLGYTQHGPHRADLTIRVNRTVPAQDLLSQGQQKLLVYALYLTQGILLKEQTGKRCIYLLDDLPAELDFENQRRVARALDKIDAQVFVTGVNRECLLHLQEIGETRLFHVEQGKIHAGNADN
jgi:DNA replication and repair protein RecF